MGLAGCTYCCATAAAPAPLTFTEPPPIEPLLQSTPPNDTQFRLELTGIVDVDVDVNDEDRLLFSELPLPLPPPLLLLPASVALATELLTLCISSCCCIND